MTHVQPLAIHTSVIVVAYNSGRALRDCVLSVQLSQPGAQVVIVDNASTDGAVQQVKSEFPAIEVVSSDRNGGFGSGCNLGAAHTKRRYLVFLNHDATVREGWLEALVGPLERDDTLGLVTPKVLLRSDPDYINVAGLQVHLCGISMCRGLKARADTLSQATEIASVSGAAFAVRREVFQALGGFDEDFFLYLEDVDLSIRAWLAGYRCLYVPAAAVLHEYGDPAPSSRKTFYLERGRYLMLLKSLRPGTLLGLLPTLLLAEAITWGYVLWRNPAAVGQKLRAWGWVWAHRAEIAEKRRQVQACRSAPDSAFLTQCTRELDFAQLAGPGMARAAHAVFAPLLEGAAQIACWATR